MRTRTENPLDGIAVDRRLPAAHPLAVLADKAITVDGLDDREWRALGPTALRQHGTQISKLRRRANTYRADCKANGELPSAAHLARLRDEVLAHFARVIPEHQKPLDAPLGQFLARLLRLPPRPATYARDLRKALANYDKDGTP